MASSIAESLARSEESIGRAKIEIANKGRTQFGGTFSNEERIDLAKSGTKDFLPGMQKLNRIIRNASPDISKMTRQIMKASEGKPLKTSITLEQRKKDKEEAKTVFLLLQRLLGTDTAKASEATTDE